MPIAFEGVSYSYTDPARSEKKRRGKAAARGAAEAGAGADASAKPAWGGGPDATWALRDITFTLADGEFLGVAGHTGSGKSTLIQHMNGLLSPTRGRVLVDGEDLADKHVANARRGKIGLVFQYPEHQLFAATVYDDVAFGPRNLGLSSAEVDARVRTALESVRLDFDEVRDMSPFELSGGQQRRVAFAGVLAMGPTTLVLDEPTAGLDPVSRAEFRELIAEFHAGGLTIVMVSHNMNDLAQLADRILVLNEGAQFALGTPEEIFLRGAELHAIGLGVPDAQRLADALADEGVALPQRLFAPESLADEVARLWQAGAGARAAEADGNGAEAPAPGASSERRG